MLNRIEALKILKTTLKEEKRVINSINVAKIMSNLADYFNEDVEFWYITGLLHDLDLPETINNLEFHGLITAKKLAGLLPSSAVDAIKTHEYRTGLKPASILGESLIFADMYEIIRRTMDINSNWNELKTVYPSKKYHLTVIENFYNRFKNITIDEKQLNLQYIH